MVRRAVAEVGSGRARARDGLRRGSEPLGIRGRHRQGALDPGEDLRDPVRAHDSKPAYRDLELDADGETIWAACICDKVGVNPAKALVKLNTEGKHIASWLTQAGTGSFGQSVVDHNGKLFLTAGGSDFVAEFDKTAGGARGWKRDTSGSAQAVAVYDGQLVVGGHFYYVGDDRADKCGAGRPGDPLLDPNGECQRRQGIAAYSFGGRLDPDWDPVYSGSYSLVWELHARAQAAHRRRVQDGQRDHPELLRAALAGFPVG